MLKLVVQNMDIGAVSKILSIGRLRASVTESEIIIYNDVIPGEVIENLCGSITIISAQNYNVSEDEIKIEKEVTISDDVGESYTDCKIEQIPIRINIQKSEMVCRGEVYSWRTIRKDEQENRNIKECVIIIQNDYDTSVKDDTIALFCSTEYRARAPINFCFRLSEEVIEDYNQKNLKDYKFETMFVGHIKGISRKELGCYLGKLNHTFMNNLQPTIDFCLGLKRSRTVNWTQLQMLATIEMQQLFEISDSKMDSYQKITEYLKLFKFDMNMNGIEYLKKAILVATEMGDYRLEDLAEIVAKNEGIEATEVFRLIIARVKENFNFKKASTISFIRLIDKLIRRG